MPKKKKQPKRHELPKPKGDWDGALYLKQTQLTTPDGKLNKHWGGIYSKETKLVCDPTYRDIGQCLAFLMKESLQACSKICYPDDADANLALDTIGQFMAKIWNESLQDNLSGLCQFRSLYQRLGEIPGGHKTYSVWAHYFVQTYFCYLFTVQKMANGLRPGWLQEAAEYNAMLTVLNALDDDLKKQVLAQLLDRGVWPTNMSYSGLVRRLDDFVRVVIEGQELRLKEQQTEAGDE